MWKDGMYVRLLKRGFFFLGGGWGAELKEWTNEHHCVFVVWAAHPLAPRVGRRMYWRRCIGRRGLAPLAPRGPSEVPHRSGGCGSLLSAPPPPPPLTAAVNGMRVTLEWEPGNHLHWMSSEIVLDELCFWDGWLHHEVPNGTSQTMAREVAWLVYTFKSRESARLCYQI